MQKKQLQNRSALPLGERIKHALKTNGALYIMLIAPMVTLILFHYVPMYGVQIAFRDYRPARGILGSAWVGFKYFQKFFSYYKFWDIIRNTLIINFYNLLTFPLSLVLALMLNYVYNKTFKKTVQMLSYAPHFISTVVICSMVLVFTSKTGLIGQLTALFGGEPSNLMARPDLFYTIFVWSGVWQELGYSSIIYIAALSGISPELHEAAIVDGANIFKRIWHIDLPGVLPTFCILLILKCGQLMNIGYEKVLLLQNNLNTNVSEVISTYAYEMGIATTKPQYSYSAAIGLFTSLVNMIMLLSVNLVSRRISGNSLF